MKLGMISALFQNMPFETIPDHVAEMGLLAAELGTGAFPSEQPSAMGRA